MLFKSNTEYAPDAGSDDAAEATAEAAHASPARKCLGKLLLERDEAAAEMVAIQGSLRKLASMASAVPPLVARLDLIRAESAERYRLWSELLDSEAPAPEPNEEGESLVRQIAAAKLSADTAASAVPLKQTEFVRSQAKFSAITESINSAIAAIIRDEMIAPRLEQIIAIKADLAERAAMVEAGNQLALETAEKIPLERRTQIAGEFYQNGGAFEQLRVRAISPPAPSTVRYYDGWRDLALRLAVDPSATVAEG